MISQPRPQAGHGRLEYLDALRGIAAILVVFQHALQFPTTEFGFHWALLEWINLGRFGVLLFFLISGFVVPFSFKGDQPLRGFAISRASRLLPALWLSVALELFFLALNGGWAGPITILVNMVMLARPLGMTELHLGYWTLSLELGFYVFCALAFSIGALRHARLSAIIALFLLYLACYSRNEWLVFPAFFVAGLVLRLAIYEKDRDAMPWAIFLCCVLVPVAAWVGAAPSTNEFLLPFSRGLAMALPLPVFLAAILWRPSAGKKLQWLGRISYSVYLFQNIAFYVCEPLLGPTLGDNLVYLAAVILFTLGFSHLTYHFVEAPVIAMGKRIIAGLQTKREPLTA